MGTSPAGERRATTNLDDLHLDVFLVAGAGRSASDGLNVQDGDPFGSPDGVWADPTGRIWIQTAACPVFPGKRYLDWELDDPAGQGLDEVRRIRDDIDTRVQALVRELVPA